MEYLKLQELNSNQLESLAKLCFDLAKGALLVGIFPATAGWSTQIPFLILSACMGMLAGLAFTYFGLLLLTVKKGIQT